MKAKLRLAVVGTGMMATMRTKAFLETGQVEIAGIASRNASKAVAFAASLECSFSTDDFTELADCRPDMVLVEVPHHVQTEVVKWALEQQYHVLVGSSMAVNMQEMNYIRQLSAAHNLVVEGGFEARYKTVWKEARTMIHSGKIGNVCAIQAIACWKADTESWYYSQKESGGMPVTHMTYAFLNPLTWIFGMPRSISAIANTTGVQRPGMVEEVTCAANIAYKDHIPCQLLASYVHHPQTPNWKLFIQGTSGALEIFPGEFGNGKLVFYPAGDASPIVMSFENAPDPFVLQAETFIRAVKGLGNELQNTPAHNAEDVQIAATIVKSARTGKTIHLNTDLKKTAAIGPVVKE